MHEIDRTIEAVRRIAASGRRGVLITIVATRGSTYRRSGARAVIAEDGQTFGTLSGGCLERDLAERIAPWLEKGQPLLITYDSSTSDDVIFGLGLGCRGVVDLLVEPFDARALPALATQFAWKGREPVQWNTTFEGRELLREIVLPPPALIVFGGGTDVPAVATIAADIGWTASVIAPRDLHPDDVPKKVDPSAWSAAIVMTHNFLHDRALLSFLLPSPIPYVGLLGPRERADEILRELALAPEASSRLHAPIGLDLGGETPEEIALSIIAEIQMVLRGSTGSPLSSIDAPIHRKPAR